MFHLHTWSRWKEIRVTAVDHSVPGVERTTYEYRQRRSCARCGLIRERAVA